MPLLNEVLVEFVGERDVLQFHIVGTDHTGCGVIVHGPCVATEPRASVEVAATPVVGILPVTAVATAHDGGDAGVRLVAWTLPTIHQVAVDICLAGIASREAVVETEETGACSEGVGEGNA